MSAQTHIILHIGHHKTGTSSLQVHFARNYKSWMEQGVLYPSVEAAGFSHNLRQLLNPVSNSVAMSLNAEQPHNGLAQKMLAEVSAHKVPVVRQNLPSSAQMFWSIRKQIEVLSPKTVVLCAEVFSKFGKAGPAQIDRLREELPDAKFTIYCALRRPDDYLASWQGQRLKFGLKLKPLPKETTSGYFHGIHFDYRLLLEAWIDRMPDANFIIRTYDDVLSAGGSVQDFHQQTAIQIPANVEKIKDSNPSIAYALQDVARRGNLELTGPDARDLRAYLMGLRNKLTLPPNRDVEMFGADTRAKMLARFLPIEEYLRSVTGKPAFFPNIESIGQTRPIPEADARAQALTKNARILVKKAPSNNIRDFLKAEIANAGGH